MNLLDKIVEHKRKEVASNRDLYPIKLLEQSPFFQGQPVSLRGYIERPDKSGIIAEIKRKSPSRGVINTHVSIEELSIGYMQAGASALSVLTDKEFFGGSNEDLSTARKFNFCPILRKDFVVDDYQVIEAKAIGADAVLLIARILQPEEVRRLASLARSFGMQVLLEIHSKEELLRSFTPEIDLVGVNNRNLDTLTVDVNLSHELVEAIPSSACKVAESGLSSAEVIKKLKDAGYSGFLIGEAFMATAHPHRSCSRLVSELRKLGERA